MTDLINMGMGIDFYKISFLWLVVCLCHVIVNTFLNYFFLQYCSLYVCKQCQFEILYKEK